jgi:hypothetical protein
MRWTDTALTVSSAQAEWRYPHTVCGRYAVEVYVPAHPGDGAAATSNALYQIGHRLGLASRLVDQAAYPGKWVSLGEWEFLPTDGSFVRLTNATGEDPILDLHVLFDAVRWTFVSPCQ